MSSQDKPRPPEPFKITHVRELCDIPNILHNRRQISANFETFTAYSTGGNSVVLMGDEDTHEGTVPKIIPSLQNQSVISVVLGDYHCGALTSTGKLLTWGAYSKGALGLGDPAHLPLGAPGGFTEARHRNQAQDGFMRATPEDVKEPTEVRFDHGVGDKKDTFCFAVAAAGWHMGALVIDMDVIYCSNRPSLLIPTDY